MEFLSWLEIVGGVCTTGTAREHLSLRELRRLRATGALWVPLRGWVALRGVRNDVTRCLEIGGVATCATAFRQHGLWVPHGDEHLHVRVHRETHSARLTAARSLDGVRIHRAHHNLAEQRPWDGVDGVLFALTTATACLHAEDVVAAADAALARGAVGRTQLADVAARLPRRRRRALERASHLSGSGTESRFAGMLRGRGIAFVQQPELLPGEFFDFLIGTSLVIEIDSVEWHGSRQQMAKDRVRDARLTALGYRVVRLTYEQVMFDPDYVLTTVLALVQRNMHRRQLLP
jgi:very-short-patch-repair endonuclease